MNTLRQQIRSCMRSFASGGNGTCSAAFRFPKSFAGFDGHFPSHPVLPGFCALQAVLLMIEAHKKTPVRLREIASAKFFDVIRPAVDVRVNGRLTDETPNAADFRASLLSDAGRKLAEFSLKVDWTAIPSNAHATHRQPPRA